MEPITSRSGTEEAVIRRADEPSGVAWLLPTVSVLVSLILGLVLWQCGDGSSETAAASAERGVILYREAGCAACHGQTGLGGSGPALGGHSADQVVRQVRAPYGAMPLFTRNELGDNDLAAIVRFIEDLDPVDHSLRWGPGPNPRDELAMHHLLALAAIRDGDLTETAKQIDLISELIVGEHLDVMNAIADLIDEGETTEAELLLANMSGGQVPEASPIDG